MTENFPIDIVLPWVDGDDPKHIKHRNMFCTDYGETLREDVGGNSRFQSLGEIRHCVESINMFAPFIRKIFIVTDNQDPQLEDHIREKFPHGHIPMEIVDHRIIFKGFEEYLPVFNSRAIEAMIWRIPELSEHFILMNDDFMFVNHVSPEDFFRNGKTVCYAKRKLILWSKLIGLFRKKSKGHKRISFKESMINAALIMKRNNSYLYLGHTPRALKKSFYEDFFSQREDVMKRNISFRFRDGRQYNSQELFYISEDRKGQCLITPFTKKLLYIMPKRGGRYIDRKLAKMDRNKSALFCCINTISLAGIDDQRKILEWVKSKLYQKRQKSE